MNKENTRQSNIELLRIFAALGVIILHLNNGNQGGFFLKVDRFSSCQLVVILFEAVAIGAVNVFVLITGYFMAEKNQADLFKPARLFIDMFMFAGFFFLGKLIATNGVPTENYINYIAFYNWFIFIFAGLYVFSPFINKLWRSISGRNKVILMSLMFVLFSLYPELIDSAHLQGVTAISYEGDMSGYTIVQFVLMYLTGCSLRDIENNKESVKKTAARLLHISEKDFNAKTLPVLYLLDLALIIALSYLEAYMFGTQPHETIMFNYNNPLVIFQAVLVFLMFRSINIPNSKVINLIAKSAFYVYIIHHNFIVIFNIHPYRIDDPLLLAGFLLGMGLLIFVLCFVCFIVYDLTFGKLIALIARKWKKGRYIKVD